MSLSRLESLLNDQIKELYAAEVHVAKEMPRLIEGAFSSELKSLLQEYWQQVQNHEKLLSQLLKQQGPASHASHSKAIETLLKRAVEIAHTRGNSALLDVELLSVLCQVGSYKRVGYEQARTIAETVNNAATLKILDAQVRDEAVMEQSCTVLLEDMIDTIHVEEARRAGTPKQEAGEAPVG